MVVQPPAGDTPVSVFLLTEVDLIPTLLKILIENLTVCPKANSFSHKKTAHMLMGKRSLPFLASKGAHWKAHVNHVFNSQTKK